MQLRRYPAAHQKLPADAASGTVLKDLNEISWHGGVPELLRRLLDLIEHDLRHLPLQRSIRVATATGKHQCSGEFAAVLIADPPNFVL